MFVKHFDKSMILKFILSRGRLILAYKWMWSCLVVHRKVRLILKILSIRRLIVVHIVIKKIIIFILDLFHKQYKI